MGIAFFLRLVPNSTGVIAMVAANLNTEKLPSLKRNSRPPLGNSFIKNISANPTHQEFSSYRGSLSTSFWMKQKKRGKKKERKERKLTKERSEASSRRRKRSGEGEIAAEKGPP